MPTSYTQIWFYCRACGGKRPVEARNGTLVITCPCGHEDEYEVVPDARFR